MKKTLAMTFAVAALGLAACAPAPGPEPITDQNYGGKVSSSAGYAASGAAVTRFRGCPSWAPNMYRGDLYCLKHYSYR